MVQFLRVATSSDSPLTLDSSKASALSREVPPIVKTRGLGLRSASLRHRTNSIFAFFWVLGSLPTALAYAGVIPAYPALQAFGWGLWLPGGGFIADGGWVSLLFPVTLALFGVSMMVWAMAGMLVAPIAVWAISAAVASVLAGSHIAFYTPLAVPLVTLLIVFKRVFDERARNAVEEARGEERMSYLGEALSSLDAVAVPHATQASRELSPDDLKAARYMLNLALQPVGQFEGFTKKDNFQLAALRYQLNYISYGLAVLQGAYTPNFHGYLNQAQRFAIESLTQPKVCGYWKFEALWGKLTWRPDPIDTIDNIMLTGWSLIALSTYAANTGDLRYQEPDALKFKPFENKLTTYAHNAHTFVKSLVKNWGHCSLYLYPCEPFWSFPICNALAFCGVVPYDRVNGTDFAGSSRASFMDSLEGEFLLSDGNPRAVVSTLTGYSSLSRTDPQIELAFLLWMARTMNAIHPGYAKRWYALARQEFLQLKDGNLSLKGIKWQECFDTGNYKKTPGFALASIALAAREHGDEAMAEAALRKADELLTRVADENVYAFENVSTSANLNLAAARWGRRDDWHDLINVGPNIAALTGPILTDCEYPAVLVSKAISDGSNLDLVLYSGVGPGEQTIKIERLQKNTRYRVKGALQSELKTSEDGTARLQIRLAGRTSVLIEQA